MPYQEIQALGFPNSPRKLRLYEKPWACISSYGPCTQLVNSKYKITKIQHVTVNRPIRLNYRYSRPGKLQYRYRCSSDVLYFIISHLWFISHLRVHAFYRTHPEQVFSVRFRIFWKILFIQKIFGRYFLFKSRVSVAMQSEALGLKILITKEM